MILLDHNLYSLLNFGQHLMQVASYFSFGHVHLGHRLDHSSSTSPSHGQLVMYTRTVDLRARRYRAHQHDWRGRLVGAFFLLHGDGEGFGFHPNGHLLVHHDRIAVLIGLENSRSHGRTLHRDDPQLVSLTRRHRRKIARHEHHPVPRWTEDGSATRLLRGLLRVQRNVNGVGSGEQPHLLIQTVKLNRLVLIVTGQFGELIFHATIAAHQYDHDEQ